MWSCNNPKILLLSVSLTYETFILPIHNICLIRLVAKVPEWLEDPIGETDLKTMIDAGLELHNFDGQGECYQDLIVVG